jgi:hypothetical protein
MKALNQTLIIVKNWTNCLSKPKVLIKVLRVWKHSVLNLDYLRDNFKVIEKLNLTEIRLYFYTSIADITFKKLAKIKSLNRVRILGVCLNVKNIRV